MAPKQKKLFLLLPFLVLTGLVAAGILYFLGQDRAGHILLAVLLAIGTVPILIRIILNLFRGHLGIDLIAILAIIGAWVLGQYLAGTIILLMLSGGEALEDYARGRARRELDKLLSLAPRQAHKKNAGKVVDLPVEEILVGDILVVKPGEVVAVDGIVVEGKSEVDESALTGEVLPVVKEAHSAVMSGSWNRDRVLEIRATRLAADSKYQQIIRLVREAESQRAPIVRMADRYSVWFTVVTLGVAAAAWFFSGDPVRALAVLVVATPCPLILATPIAVVSGMSRAASRGIIIKTGEALERLGAVRSFVFDKTGTLTVGQPKVTQVDGDGLDEASVTQVAASLDQLSTHVLARSLVEYARGRKIEFSYPEDFQEFFGDGVSGVVGGKKYLLGRLSFLEKNGVHVPEKIVAEHKEFQAKGIITVYLATTSELVGDIHFSDVARPETGKLFASLRSQGVGRIVMLTGDHRDVASRMSAALGITEFAAELLPEQKVEHVKAIQKETPPLAMVGDGINDAPALAAADVGIALGGTAGVTASSESGDIVVMVNDLSRVGEAFAISRYAVRIARQSILAGIGVSFGLMALAAMGFVSPVLGALLQEVVDVAVILNALRVNRLALSASAG